MADSQSSESELVPDPEGMDPVKGPNGAQGSHETPGVILTSPNPAPPDDTSSMKSCKTVGDSTKQLSLATKTQVDSSLKEFPFKVV